MEREMGKEEDKKGWLLIEGMVVILLKTNLDLSLYYMTLHLFSTYKAFKPM
jgi:hypothetical protein